ncbi:amidohydrolase family protein [Hymenobacter radiodurans]|uniref:hypothetical protein n=1 Tax=Hymenobacter radiodurans TaxID=2496028 RepID=UPI00105852A2|nr:hypothetical protein [Hymenobacter radiodurans]
MSGSLRPAGGQNNWLRSRDHPGQGSGELTGVKLYQGKAELGHFRTQGGNRTRAHTGKAIVTMPPEVIRAATAAAHTQGKPVFAHPTDNTGVAAAVTGGVDVLVHVAPEDRKNWSPALIKALRAQHVALIPTLKLYHWELERTGHAPANHPLLLTAVEQLLTYAAAGGKFCSGRTWALCRTTPRPRSISCWPRPGCRLRRFWPR